MTNAGPQSDRRRFGPSPRTAWALFTGGVILYLIYRVRVVPKSIDLAVYRATGAAVAHGGSIYGKLELVGHLRATYPPFAALVFVPLSAFPLTTLRYVVLAMNVLLLLVIALAATRLGRTLPKVHRLPVALTVAGCAMVCEPVVTTLNLGQIDLAIVALVMLDLARSNGAPMRGAGVGLAAAVKLTPALFIVYLLITHRVRDAAVATGVFVGASALGWVLLPSASRTYWTQIILDIRRVGLVARPDNQSLRGFFGRLAGAPDTGAAGMVIIAIVGATGLVIAGVAYQRLGEEWGVLTTAFTGLLVSPISWTHHWVWCVPVALVLWTEARQHIWTVAVFWSHVVAIPHNAFTTVTRYTPFVTIVSGAYAYFGAFFLALVVHRAVHAQRWTRRSSTCRQFDLQNPPD